MRARIVCCWREWAATTSQAGRRHKRLFFSTTALRSDDVDDGESQAERSKWLTRFEAYQEKSRNPLPKDWITTNFSRSSGPGGQNVNKVNTKAEVRLNLGIASKEQAGMPTMTKEVIRYLTQNSSYYVASTHSLLTSSMKTRTQSGNLEDAIAKMQSHIQTILAQGIAGETSAEQHSRVKGLIAKDKAKTRRSKERRGSVKKDRGRISADY
ncbi:hypothetical protein CBS101457_001588 [Exobasidium rhododendri]|nr:hypothetical protein CBS101457_001588 [Exobasidium rhododendri]